MRWIIGDVHGMLRSLEGLLAALARRDPSARFYFCGDYVNRGPDSRRVIDLLLSLPPDMASFVRGNHDDIFDIILHGRGYCDHPRLMDPPGAFTWFMNHGLAETLTSYGLDYAQLEHAASHPTPEALGRIVSAVPEDHRWFIRSLPAVIEEKDLFVAHAMWDADEADESPGLAERLAGDGALRFKVLWGRYPPEEILRTKRWRRTGYFGHTPVDNYRPAGPLTPIRGPNIVLLDTGAALSPAGRLTAVCAETGDVIQVNRSGAVAEAK
jgi:hypothetical protein